MGCVDGHGHCGCGRGHRMDAAAGVGVGADPAGTRAALKRSRRVCEGCTKGVRVCVDAKWRHWAHACDWAHVCSLMDCVGSLGSIAVSVRFSKRSL